MLYVTRTIFTNVATETSEADETDLVRLPDNNLYPNNIKKFNSLS